jgi:hypothetical protein
MLLACMQLVVVMAKSDLDFHEILALLALLVQKSAILTAEELVLDEDLQLVVVMALSIEV